MHYYKKESALHKISDKSDTFPYNPQLVLASIWLPAWSTFNTRLLPKSYKPNASRGLQWIIPSARMFGNKFYTFYPITWCLASQDGFRDGGHKVCAITPTPTATPTQHCRHRTSQWTVVQFYATKQRMYFCLCRTSTTTLVMVFTTEYHLRHSAVHGSTLSLWAVQSTILTNEPIF